MAISETLFLKMLRRYKSRMLSFYSSVLNIYGRNNRTRIIYNHLKKESKRRYLCYRHGALFKKRVQGSLMELDLRDRGISADLARDGIREPITTEAYQNELDRMQRSTDDTITVIDIGANIGYYALMPPARITNCEILAIEPDPENIIRLQRNVDLNGYHQSVTVRESAVGSESEVASLYRAHYSNFHTMQKRSWEEQSERFRESIPVTVSPLSEMLKEENIEPSDVDVIRMDVEGYESQIFNGMSSVFESSSDLLLNIEIHPVLMSDEEVEGIINQFQRSEAVIISAAQGDQGIELSTLDEIRTYPWLELVMKL